MARTYTDEEVAKALTHYQEHGATQTAINLGIPKQTVHSWALKAGVRTVHLEKMAEAHEAKRLAWETRRIELAHDIGQAAAEALAVARENLGDGATSRAKDAALTMAIMVDKAQLLTGAATSRPDHTSGATVEDEIRRLAAELDLPNPVKLVESNGQIGNQVDA